MQEKDRQNVASLLPQATEFDKPFWDSLQNKKLLIQRCPVCGHTQFPPSPVCTECLSDKVEWVECCGEVTLWSKVWFHKKYLKPYDDVPYAVITAKLKEGHYVTGRMDADEAREAEFDAPLDMEFVETADGTVLINFKVKK